MRCEDQEKTIAIVVCIGVAVIAILVVYIYLIKFQSHFYQKLRRKINLITQSGSLKILLLYLQITASLNSAWPEWAILRGMSWLNISNMKTSGLGWECLMPFLSNPYYNLLSTLLLVPIITIAILCLVSGRRCYSLVMNCYHERRGGHQTTIHQNGSEEDLPDSSTSSAGEGNETMTVKLETNQTTSERTMLISRLNPLALEDITSRDETTDEVESSDCHHPSEEPITTEQVGGLSAAEMSEDFDAPPFIWGLSIWMYALYFLYFELATRTLETFNCPVEPITERQFMQSLPWLQCSR